MEATINKVEAIVPAVPYSATSERMFVEEALKQYAEEQKAKSKQERKLEKAIKKEEKRINKLKEEVRDQFQEEFLLSMGIEKGQLDKMKSDYEAFLNAPKMTEAQRLATSGVARDSDVKANKANKRSMGENVFDFGVGTACSFIPEIGPICALIWSGICLVRNNVRAHKAEAGLTGKATMADLEQGEKVADFMEKSIIPIENQMKADEPMLVQKYEECKKKGNMAEFTEFLQSYVSGLMERFGVEKSTSKESAQKGGSKEQKIEPVSAEEIEKEKPAQENVAEVQEEKKPKSTEQEVKQEIERGE